MTKKRLTYIKPTIYTFCAKEDVTILSGSAGSKGDNVGGDGGNEDPFPTKQSPFFFDDEDDYDDEDDFYKW